MASGISTTSTQFALIQALWQKMVLRAFVAKYIFRQVFTTIPVSRGFGTMYIPSIGDFTAEQIVEGSDMTAQNPGSSLVTLNIDQHYGVYFPVTERLLIQALQNPATFELLAGQAASAVNTKIELLLSGQYSAMSQEYLPSGGNLTPTDVAAVKRQMKDNNVPDDNLTLVITPSQEFNLATAAGISTASAYGTNSVIMRGKLEEVYGCKIATTTNVIANSSYYNCMLINPEHTLVTIQKDVTIEIQQTKEIKSQSYPAACTVLFGFKELKDVCGIRIPTTS